MEFTKENVLNEMEKWWTSRTSWNDIKREIEKMEDVEMSMAARNIQMFETHEKLHMPSFSQTNFYTLSDSRDNLEVTNKKTKEKLTPMTLSILFSIEFEPYEEPKYREVDTNHALIQYALQGMNKNILLQFEGREYFIEELVQNSVAFSTIDGETGMGKKREDLQGLIWRIYEN